jgi:4-hydroxy-3-polyprenylbenzoate decarboxylase
MGSDATVPFGYESDFMRPGYPVERIDLKKWFNDKDIQNSKGRMQGWVHSLARTGR